MKLGASSVQHIILFTETTDRWVWFAAAQNVALLAQSRRAWATHQCL